MKSRSIVFLLMVMVVAISCKNNQSNKQVITKELSEFPVASEDSEQLVDIYIDVQTVPLFDTLRLGELIQEVKYIPLETSKQSYLSQVRDVHFNNDHYYVSHGVDIGSCRMLAFDKNGNYLYDIYGIGRGRNEISLPIDRFYNDSKNIIGVAGAGGEILIVNELTRISTKKHFEDLDFPLHPRSLRNGCFVGIPYAYAIDKENPYMVFYDSAFNVIGSVSDDRDRKHRNIEGVTTSPMLKRIISQSGDNLLYKDMDNDTVFSVKENGTLVPSIVINIPKKLKPTLRESEIDTKKKKNEKIYLDNIAVCKDYIVISYYYQNMKYIGFWSKNTGMLVYRSASFLGNSPFCFQINNLKGQSNMYDLKICSNKFLTALPSTMMKNEIDSLNEDDNPVLVEVTLVDANTIDYE